MDGIRTRDHSDHNRELYQLSYHRRRWERLFASTDLPGQADFMAS
jgi:hypothetical protein